MFRPLINGSQLGKKSGGRFKTTLEFALCLGGLQMHIKHAPYAYDDGPFDDYARVALRCDWHA